MSTTWGRRTRFLRESSTQAATKTGCFEASAVLESQKKLVFHAQRLEHPYTSPSALASSPTKSLKSHGSEDVRRTNLSADATVNGHCPKIGVRGRVVVPWRHGCSRQTVTSGSLSMKPVPLSSVTDSAVLCSQHYLQAGILHIRCASPSNI